MSKRGLVLRLLVAFWISTIALTVAHSDAIAQPKAKKVRLGIAATSVGFLPIYAAYHKGFS